MEADSKDMTIEQLQEQINNLNKDLTQLSAIVPSDADSSFLSQSCKFLYALILMKTEMSKPANRWRSIYLG